MDIETRQELAEERDRAYRRYLKLDWLVFVNRDYNEQRGKPLSFETVISRLQNPIHPLPESCRKEFELAIKILTEGQAYLTKHEPIRIIFFDDNASE